LLIMFCALPVITDPHYTEYGELQITHNIMLMTDSLGFGNCIIRRLPWC
jgi:hypothetical protein